MKKLLLFMIGTLLAFGAGAGITLRQLELQPCQGFESTKWNYCIGIFTFSGGSKYVGEWKGGKRSGKGLSSMSMVAFTSGSIKMASSMVIFDF